MTTCQLARRSARYAREEEADRLARLIENVVGLELAQDTPPVFPERALAVRIDMEQQQPAGPQHPPYVLEDRACD